MDLIRAATFAGHRGVLERSILKTVQIISNLGHYGNEFLKHDNLHGRNLLFPNILPEINHVIHCRQQQLKSEDAHRLGIPVCSLPCALTLIPHNERDL
jgi:hypothetical protein